MNKNQFWKLGFIILLVVAAVALVYPPQDKLKPGLDLGGGVSLIYDIDTEGLDASERKGLAQRMIPILRRRIDPTNVANIVMKPQGDTRIEIQIPLASAETIEKRKDYEASLESLEKDNINLLKIRNALSVDAEAIDDAVAKYADDSEERKEILSQWANVNSERNVLIKKRDALNKQLSDILDKLEEASVTGVENAAARWSKLDGKELADAVESFAKGNNKNAKLINKYLAVYRERTPVVNDLTRSETGLHAQYRAASMELSKLNLGQGQVMDVLALGEKSPVRSGLLDEMKKNFPGRAEKIDEVTVAYDAYQAIGGRLDDPEDLKRMLKGAGVLEFRILPTTADTVTRPGELQAYQLALAEKGPKQASDSKYVWLEVEDPESFTGMYQEIGQAALGVFGEKTYVLASNQPKETMLRISGEKAWKLRRAYPTVDEMGRRAIGFTHDETAAKLFYRLTNANIKRPLCIVLDGQAITAPTLNSAIRASGIITGEFTQVEVEDSVNKLNAGSFPARLSDVPISEKSIGATIGAENRNQGTKAGKYGLIAVCVFMTIYYLLAGVIAVIALCMNLLFILAMMVLFDATFTLPGIAGLILTIGMSVDANVLIFERIREEHDRGASLRTAIANGYQRAFRTIFDANITTFFVALILYVVASEEIKGFAIVLMLGIASSMFTALFATRVIFDCLMDIGILKNNIKMLKLIRKPSIDWMSMRGAFFGFSALMVMGGLFVFVTRDEVENSKWDIEFTGGTSFIVDFIDDPVISETWVRERIQAKGEELNNPSLAASKVYSVGKSGLQYEITTTETNKTIATVKFAEAGQTVESVTAEINAAAEGASGTLYKLSVTSEDGKSFVVSTSQVSKSLVRNVLAKAFGDKAAVTEPKVNEFVSIAVREAFDNYLKIRESLVPTIVSVDKVDESTVDLTDYIGGTAIKVDLENETTYKDLVERFKDIRFKSDMQNLSWHQYMIVGDDLTVPEDDKTVKSFVYVSVHPDAGYRDFSSDEWSQFINNEKAKINSAASLQTTLSRVTQIDPSIGKEAMYRALMAIILSLIAIVAYIWIRFGNANFGFAAIAALVHDVCIVLGMVTVCTYLAGKGIGDALLIQDFKIDLAMIAAFLTIIGYSLNDTIVVFDRIRENRGKQTKLTKEIISKSINQTLSRTLLTSLTTFMVVLIMYIWGGEGLRGFTFAMLVGILVGTYSSIAIAAPILLLSSKKKAASK